jgi:hypothetical protein
MSDRRPKDRESDEVATLHGAMREAIGQGLQARYRISREIPHALLVLLMQMNEKRRKAKPAAASAAFRLRSSAHVWIPPLLAAQWQ